MTQENNPFFTTRRETEEWLQSMRIDKYFIGKDLKVNVGADVNISYKDLSQIPVQFDCISGSFLCHQNQLITLKGCPNYVEKDFYCAFNKIDSLEFAPIQVNGDFYCIENQLKSLKHAPKIVGNNFVCDRNEIEDFSDLEFEVKGKIVFKSLATMNYLDSYKNAQGNIDMPFTEFKKIQLLKQLNEKLERELLKDLHTQKIIIKKPKI